MRLKNPRTFLVLYTFVQVTCAYRHTKNADHIKNSQRTNPKKYDSTSGGAPMNLNLYPKQLIDRKLSGLSSVSSSISSKNSDRTLKNNNNKWYDKSGRPVRHRHNYMTRTTTTTTTTPSPDEELFNNYGDLYDGDYPTEDDYSDDLFEAANNDFDEEFQAEEPSTTERTTPAPHQYSEFSNFKFKFLGTRQRVRQAMESLLQSNELATKSSQETKTSAAVEHFFRIRDTAQCRTPTLKVIPVHIEHPDPSVTYIPHCTVLHRCAEDTGCCLNDTTCQYKEREEVTLYFYVRRFGFAHPSVEKLTFYNHTECECRGKSEERHDDKRVNTPERGKRMNDLSSTSPTITYKSASISRERQTSKIKGHGPESLVKKCKCPKEFIARMEYGKKCYCDCDLSNDDCMRMKKGKEYSSLIDRQCIQNQECGTVLCQYGSYNIFKGRCPKYEET